ncbi:hypothetical protein GGH12_003529 [Coemansia sp. RSA 1822]|nr:hypothetical protein LPJ76_005423 [Coemansia sp. RSA 638]KAJ2124792.1 hypothetical protein IW147_001397 [Coemansia sp. RSA 720]KAJ2541882.1 hypothetical protein GGF49_003299 [Coemansia sp. RSA 1853]KAJ2562008.1 hypothetical protein GGH12_003529 [Coemansia sp. RSA 1822]
MRGLLKLLLVALLFLALSSVAQKEETSPSTTKEDTKETPTPSSNATSRRSSSTKDDEGDEKTDDSEQESLPEDEATAEESDDEEPTPSFDESYDETGMPGTVELTTPDYMTIPTPMFEIGEKITLGWKYGNDTKRPPEKLSICGKFPRGSNKSPNAAALCDWDIAVNISGSLRKYEWDTVTQGMPGAAFVADSGYLLRFYDSEYGVNNAMPGAGRIVPSVFWFNMYNSRYDLTNQGVPVGYDPSSASSLAIGVCSVFATVLCAMFV